MMPDLVNANGFSLEWLRPAWCSAAFRLAALAVIDCLGIDGQSDRSDSHGVSRQRPGKPFIMVNSPIMPPN
jgi:hypothetical protein